MKILITSGGTKVKIDMVRSITNMSKGTFGCNIANSFIFKLKHKDEILFLMAKESFRPMNVTEHDSIASINEYVTFEDYERLLFDILEGEKPDIVILAAAVSDYGVENYVDGKIRSSEELIIHLKPLPKLISKVRDIVPNAVICGFKLLVNSNETELYTACFDSIWKNKIDLVVGNDLRDIKAGNHTLHIMQSYWPESALVRTWNRFEKSKHNLANVVRDKCLESYERLKNHDYKDLGLT